MPKKMRQAALRSALSVKAGSGQIIVVDDLSMEAPKTKEMVRVLTSLGIDGQSALILLPERDMPVERSARNLPKVKTLLYNYLNIQDLLGYDVLVLPKASVDQIHAWLGQPEVKVEEEVE